jgi:hypothetical protein
MGDSRFLLSKDQLMQIGNCTIAVANNNTMLYLIRNPRHLLSYMVFSQNERITNQKHINYDFIAKVVPTAQRIS